MTLIYTGPPSLERLFQNEWQSVSGDYDRQDHRVVIGFPGASEWALYHRGFESQDSFNKYVDWIAHGIEFGRREQLKDHMERLSKISFALEGQKYAEYIPLTDSMYFDALVSAYIQYDREFRGTVRFKLIRDSGKHQEITADFQKGHLKHELVHSDLGECLPDKEGRKLFAGDGEILNRGLRINNALKKYTTKQISREDMEEVYRREGDREVAERYAEVLGIKIDELDSRRIGEAVVRLSFMDPGILKRSTQLGIRIAGEALAANYSGGRESFDRSIKKVELVDDPETAWRVYKELERKIQSNGKLPTLREVKRAIDTAWTEGRHFSEVFL